MKHVPLLLAAVLLPSLVPLAARQEKRAGPEDAPFLPGSQWRVHDRTRPAPPVVVPGVGAAPPSDAIVLFAGTSLEAWRNADGGEPWDIADGAMVVKPNAGSIETVEHFGDVQLHLEWAAPAEVAGDGQGRGNSGVFLMGLYEVQILDSYENATYPDGQAAALYGMHPPLVNACRPPGEWQSYDIFFRAPVFRGTELVSPAAVTVLHNGVVVHHAAEFLGASTHGKLPVYVPHAPAGPILLQDHWYPVRFRNIWARRL
ncbi:MAG: DUF1080 domain-containing protein [Planctomycetota bacterium]